MLRFQGIVRKASTKSLMVILPKEKNKKLKKKRLKRNMPVFVKLWNEKPKNW